MKSSREFMSSRSDDETDDDDMMTATLYGAVASSGYSDAVLHDNNAAYTSADTLPSTFDIGKSFNEVETTTPLEGLLSGSIGTLGTLEFDMQRQNYDPIIIETSSSAMLTEDDARPKEESRGQMIVENWSTPTSDIKPRAREPTDFAAMYAASFQDRNRISTTGGDISANANANVPASGQASLTDNFFGERASFSPPLMLQSEETQFLINASNNTNRARAMPPSIYPTTTMYASQFSRMEATTIYNPHSSLSDYGSSQDIIHGLETEQCQEFHPPQSAAKIGAKENSGYIDPAPADDHMEMTFEKKLKSIPLLPMPPPEISIADAPPSTGETFNLEGDRSGSAYTRNRKPLPNRKEYVEMNDLDVRFGRGSGPKNHPGNVQYLDLVESSKPAYNATQRKLEKTQMAADIVEEIKRRGGRFIQYEEETERWFVAHDVAARTKTAAALRQNTTEAFYKEKREKYGC